MRKISLALLALLWAALPAHGQDHPLKIGTVNRNQIFKSIKEMKDHSDELAAETQRLNVEGQQKTDEVRKLMLTRDSTYKPDHPQYASMSETISQKLAEAKIWEEVQRDRLARKEKSHLLATYKKVEASVAKIAEQEHVDLVLSISEHELPASSEQMSGEQLQGLIASRIIVYANKNVPDLTEKVIAQLDADYAQKR